MAIYLASVDLRKIGHDYLGFYDYLTEIDAHRALATAWLIETREPPPVLNARLLKLMAPGDGLFLLEITERSAWAATGLADNTGTWLKQKRA